MRPVVIALLVGCLTAAILWRPATEPDATAPPTPTAQFSISPEQAAAVASTAAATTASDSHHGSADVLTIPELNITATIDPILLTEHDGVIDAPIDATAVGVWDGGASLDASAGTTLLVGHVQTRDISRGALWDLAHATPSMVITTHHSGQVQRWAVVELTSVAKAEGIPPHILHSSGERRLAIVTCGGDNQMYNVIVIATPID